MTEEEIQRNVDRIMERLAKAGQPNMITREDAERRVRAKAAERGV